MVRHRLPFEVGNNILVVHSLALTRTFRPLAQVINRSVRYKNRYVHRRDSLSLANITLDEKEKLAKIGTRT